MSFFANQWKLDEHGTFITSAFGDSNDYIAFEHLSTDNFLSLREEQAAKAAQFVKERSEDAINGKMKMNFVSAKKSD
ncbi:MAG: hypothetical protein EZS28_003727 [Streblomastix strix]|uniref:Uncharacterized protein n=1 Tax=Streblomastix strix TaxID=222440 RepID=A0A5J4X0I4_9EUKA|nr:MAG: hypothetical protein EZS28_003727 [Streblomastix strix]